MPVAPEDLHSRSTLACERQQGGLAGHRLRRGSRGVRRVRGVWRRAAPRSGRTRFAAQVALRTSLAPWCRDPRASASCRALTVGVVDGSAGRSPRGIVDGPADGSRPMHRRTRLSATTLLAAGALVLPAGLRSPRQLRGAPTAARSAADRRTDPRRSSRTSATRARRSTRGARIAGRCHRRRRRSRRARGHEGVRRRPRGAVHHLTYPQRDSNPCYRLERAGA